MHIIPIMFAVWLWKNSIRGRFDEVTLPAYECAYLHAHTHVLCKYEHTAHIWKLHKQPQEVIVVLESRVQLPSGRHTVRTANVNFR